MIIQNTKKTQLWTEYLEISKYRLWKSPNLDILLYVQKKLIKFIFLDNKRFPKVTAQNPQMQE
jgi:hypothetical protein